MKAKFLSINWNDIWKSLQTAFFTGLVLFVTKLYAALSEGVFPTSAEFSSIGALSLAAMLGYIIKNILTNSQGQFLKKEPK